MPAVIATLELVEDTEMVPIRFLKRWLHDQQPVNVNARVRQRRQLAVEPRALQLFALLPVSVRPVVHAVERDSHPVKRAKIGHRRVPRNCGVEEINAVALCG